MRAACSTAYSHVSLASCSTCDDTKCTAGTCATNYETFDFDGNGHCSRTNLFILIGIVCCSCVPVNSCTLDVSVLATVATCAPVTFTAGAVKGTTNGCDDNVELTVGASCTLECDAGYVAQTATISCAIDASQGDNTVGSLACQGGLCCICHKYPSLSRVVVCV